MFVPLLLEDMALLMFHQWDRFFFNLQINHDISKDAERTSRSFKFCTIFLNVIFFELSNFAVNYFLGKSFKLEWTVFKWCFIFESLLVYHC